MPRTRPFDSYPTQTYWALAARVLDSQAPFTVPCSKTQAASLRGELFAWRRACMEDPGLAQAAGIDLARLRQVTWRITAEGLQSLLITTLPGPALITAALGGPGAEGAPAGAGARALDLLRGLLGEAK